MPGTVLNLVLCLGSFSKDRSLIKQSYQSLISCAQDFLNSQSTGSPLWQGPHVKHATWSLGSPSLLMKGRKKQLHFPLLGLGCGFCQLSLLQRGPLYRSLISNSSVLLDSQVASSFESHVSGFVLITEVYSLHGPLGLSCKLQQCSSLQELTKGSQVDQPVKNPCLQSLDQEDPLIEGVATE